MKKWVTEDWKFELTVQTEKQETVGSAWKRETNLFSHTDALRDFALA